MPLLVARYAGRQELGLKVKEAIRLLQDSAVAVQAAHAFALVLEQVVLGRPLLVLPLPLLPCSPTPHVAFLCPRARIPLFFFE